MKRIIRIVIAVSLTAALLLTTVSCTTSTGTPLPSSTESAVPSAGSPASASPAASPSSAPSEEPVSSAPSVTPDTSEASLSLGSRTWSETLDNGDVEMEYPEIMSTLAEDEQALKLANGIIAAEVQEIYEDFLEDMEHASQGFERWKLTVGFEQMLTRSEGISFRMTIEEYTGGSHSDVDTECFTWVRGKGFADMDELFGLSEDKFEKAMCSSIVSQLSDYSDLYEDADALVREEFDEDMCVLDAYGVLVRFDFYDLGPYVAGMPEFLVPYDAIGGTVPEWING